MPTHKGVIVNELEDPLAAVAAIEPIEVELLEQRARALSGLLSELALRASELTTRTEPPNEVLIHAARHILEKLKLDTIVRITDPVQINRETKLQDEGLHLRALRLSQKLTQQQLADAIGISRYSIIRIEQGKQPLRSEYRTELTKMFGLSGEASL